MVTMGMMGWVRDGDMMMMMVMGMMGMMGRRESAWLLGRREIVGRRVRKKKRMREIEEEKDENSHEELDSIEFRKQLKNCSIDVIEEIIDKEKTREMLF